jgi:hypothetical protein
VGPSRWSKPITVLLCDLAYPPVCNRWLATGLFPIFRVFPACHRLFPIVRAFPTATGLCPIFMVFSRLPWH